ncbi:nuclear transport factor 2 family protein [Sphingobacterium sp. SRCM116780]|uniref:nuclear transport factor 2 family protein n=1 Tax=Sphingobacterium sp. SRCM116780 TaxID=2907623 RepID=UPI001F42EB38|nr:nuclear transport factor 2 family protein [Sphingobacterium sp. SRCM116780]UIR56766.1 nuclear transport factor 2 family protein [Sphingobacterium sp. SRCM116780]
MNIEQELQQNADRLAIRELIDQYAYCADTRNARGQMALFTEDTNFEVYYDPKSETPSQVISKNEDLFPVFDNLNSYDATMHFNGQSTIKVTDNTALAITYCMAHHLNVIDSKQKLMIAAIRYQDKFEKQNNKWLFAERKLLVDWIENRETI